LFERLSCIHRPAKHLDPSVCSDGNRRGKNPFFGTVPDVIF
jgi:hypothetical protein